MNDTLTPREQEILDLVGQGKKSREIAEILCISINTVSSHLAYIYAKIGAENKAHAVKIIKNN